MSNKEEIRLQKAKIILSKEKAIEKIDNGIYTVKSQTGIGLYKIQWDGNSWVCNCPDFIKHGNIRPCKHILALKLYLEIGYVSIEGEESKLEPVTYSQTWATYNHAQSQEIELFDQFLCQLVSTIGEQERGGKGRPRMKLKDRVFCCIMKAYSQLSSRRAQCLYHQALQRHQISLSPHFNVVIQALNRKEITPLLRELVHLSAQPLASVETNFAIDSSGFRCSTFGQYCAEKHGLKRKHNWLKCHIATGITTNIVADVVITKEHVGDSPQLKKLLRNVSEHFAIGEVTADKAYSSRKNYEIVGSLGGTAYIPFKKNAKGTAKGSPLWKRAYHYFQLHKDEFMEHYHQRSNVESTFSAIKKKFGETIKSRNKVAQENELLCKIIAYNITVLIHEMIGLDNISEFLSFTGLKKEISMASSDSL